MLIRNIFPRPGSLWNITFKWNWRRKVNNMHNCKHCLYLECLWQLCMREHTSYPFIYCSICSLCNSIQLRCLLKRFLKVDTLSLAIGLKWSSIFTTVVWSHTLQFSASFSSNFSLKLLKYLIFSFQYESPYLSRMIIDKGNIILCTTKWSLIKVT